MARLFDRRRFGTGGPVRVLSGGLAGVLTAPAAMAHEAWLLHPEELDRISHEPPPELFSDPVTLALAALVAVVAVLVALRLEVILAPLERRIFAPLAERAAIIGPVVVRGGLAAMLVLAAAGGLPRRGTPAWAEATLLVPDMQIGHLPGWNWIVMLQLAIALMLAIGFMTRLAGLAVAALAVSGLALFGRDFMPYAPHFAAPGLMLAIAGPGAPALDRALGTAGWLQPSPALAQAGWRLALVLMGAGFVYLGITYKLHHPALVMAILDHANVPSFGMPREVMALVMAGVEITCGALLVFGRLTRPVAALLIVAMTFLATVLGETPLLHGNLYGMMAFLLISGRTAPVPEDEAPAETPTLTRLWGTRSE